MDFDYLSTIKRFDYVSITYYITYIKFYITGMSHFWLSYIPASISVSRERLAPKKKSKRGKNALSAHLRGLLAVKQVSNDFTAILLTLREG